MARLRIGEMLVLQGLLDGVQLQSALAHQRRWGGRLGRAIVQLGFMKESALLESVGQQIGVEFVEIGDRLVSPNVVKLVPQKVVRSRKAMPLACVGQGRRTTLVVALPDPADLAVVDEIAFATSMAVKPVLAAEADIERAIARHLDGVVPRRETGFAAREDAIDLPEDSSPLKGLGQADKKIVH